MLIARVLYLQATKPSLCKVGNVWNDEIRYQIKQIDRRRGEGGWGS